MPNQDSLFLVDALPPVPESLDGPYGKVLVKIPFRAGQASIPAQAQLVAEQAARRKLDKGLPVLLPTEATKSHEQNFKDRSNRLVLIISLLGSLLIPSAAFAHHAEWMKGKPFIQGLSMPVHGLDHMLVTFAVGLIAVQIGGYALWAVPAAFSLLLLLGGQ